jgi:SAM-dependent methyltransferase
MLFQHGRLKMEAGEYELMDAAEERMWWYRALHARIADALADVAGTVLDAGCGTGGLLANLRRRRDLSLVGLDWAEAPARRAAAKAGVPIARGTINDLPFADGSFDAVIAADVLSHRAVAPAFALAEACRVLRPGGRLVVNMPAFEWLRSAHDRRVHNARRHSAQQLRSTLSAAGFSVLRISYWNGLLLPVMAVQRKLLACGKRAGSDVTNYPPPLDAFLYAVTAFERRLPFQLPAGSSLFAVAQRP